MHYSLRPNLSYCVIDGRAIFLDIDGDRYFRLDDSLEAAFFAYVHAKYVDKAGIDALIEHAILTPGSTSDNRSHRLSPPTRSSLELTSGSGPIRMTAILKVFMIVRHTRRQLRTQALKDVLDNLVRYREGSRLNAASSGSHEARILDFAGLFVRSRLYVPFETSTSCLLDSVALTTYLAGHDVSANIVFGVTSDPFSAHCWVQCGDLVLNDTVGNAAAYTPIRVI